jgi:hypothetical protein
MANVIIERVNIDDHLVSLHERNEKFRTRKVAAMQSAEKEFNEKQGSIHSHNYQKQDSAIKAFAALPGRRAPGTFVQNKTGLKVFCINCGSGTLYKTPKVSGSGRLINRKKCKCGEHTAVVLKGFIKSHA